jgi:glycerophosphoryl diester phosphodiesterase
MKNVNWLKKEKIAHRGLFDNSKHIYENTLEAFNLALEHNYAIEMDIQLTLDNEIIVFHDKDLKRFFNIDKRVSQTRYEEFIELGKNGLKAPLFKDVLHHVNGQKPLLIELKAFKDYKLLVDKTMQELNSYKHPYALFSFDPRVVYYLKKKYPCVIRGQITSSFKDDKMSPFVKFMMKRMITNKLTQPDFISYDIKDLPNKYADRAFKKGLVVISFTARKKDEFYFVRKSYHNVVFENFRP